jgi:hypothetical protein
MDQSQPGRASSKFQTWTGIGVGPQEGRTTRPQRRAPSILDLFPLHGGAMSADMNWLNGNPAKGFGIGFFSFSTAPKKERRRQAASSAPPQNTVTVPQPKAKTGSEATVYDRIVGTKSPGVVYAVAPIAQRVVLYDEDPSNPTGTQYVGSVIWRTEQIKTTGNQKPDIAVRADIEIPTANSR